MALLPPRNSQAQSSSNILLDVKKGNQQARNEFIWQNQERFYAIAFMASGDPEVATQLTIMAFKNAFAALKQLNPKQLAGAAWDWLSQFIVDACAEFHMQYSGQQPVNPTTDPSADGSAQMDWETTVILGPQRVKRCLSSLAEEQRNVYILRHQLGLAYDQVATVLNQNPDNVMAWLFRARVQIVKCLGRG
jgi:RNA polymerase sigma-70 factor (ECF subfamily)